MSDHELPGTGKAAPPTHTAPLTLIITGNVDLTEVAVSTRSASRPISGRYDPNARTANVRLLVDDFNALCDATFSGGSVSIVYTYRDPDFNVVSFTWSAVARSATAGSLVPQSGNVTTAEQPVANTG